MATWTTFLSKLFVSLHGRRLGLFTLNLQGNGDHVVGGDGFHGVLKSVASAITTTGSTQAGAVQLSSFINQLGTVAASSGAMLPPMQPGMEVVVVNDGAAAAQIYPSTLEPQVTTIDGVAAATGVPLTNARRDIFWCINAGTIVSAGIGKST